MRTEVGSKVETDYDLYVRVLALVDFPPGNRHGFSLRTWCKRGVDSGRWKGRTLRAAKLLAENDRDRWEVVVEADRILRGKEARA